MTIREIEAKSILRKYKKIDSWFISRYGMNLYRGCIHNCIYCDGRAEGYYVNGEFGEDVTVKVNAIEILRRELDPKRKRTPFKRSFIMLGGGVGDSYQPIEEKYQLSRRALGLVNEYNFPVHILTKSTLIKRDIDILKKINRKSRTIVSFSFSSVNDEISAIFEPGVPPPSERLKTLTFFKNEGIACGMFLLPVIPFITDTSELMEETIRKASEANLDFIIFGGMTLKEGRQKDYFFKTLRNKYSKLIGEYENIYQKNKWGEAAGEYYNSINLTFNSIIKKYKIPPRIPLALYKDILEENDLVVVILEHIDYLLKIEGRTSPYGYAAYSISQLKEPLSLMKRQLRSIKGVGMVTEKIIKEILESKSSTYCKKLLSE
ncbi:radical SAM protein [Candidatus Atribacteria bacterium HGW-Atribacteria-1]|nr:MAG: radical SAM protein [Candidatus Atribacteria bacterium HGW-Atribacteria-1]